MMPLNQKSMYATICQTLEQLNKNEIDASQAASVAKLIQQGTNIINSEMKRAANCLANEKFEEKLRGIEISRVEQTYDSLPE